MFSNKSLNWKQTQIINLKIFTLNSFESKMKFTNSKKIYLIKKKQISRK